ncbi:YihY/virulence factor BrkB family protein [Limibacter armeniacum]|uniref:YihY/virulence factor BrkB family protein n=1 Tax=Limibacter armeniacum TaxID=466084 RepID=UPI002FE673EE
MFGKLNKIKAHIRLLRLNFHKEINSKPNNLLLDWLYRFVRFMTLVFSLLKDTFKAFNDDKAYIQGAALAYYTVFSLPPMLYIIISVVGSFVGEDMIKEEIIREVTMVAGSDIAKQLEFFINNLANPDNRSTIKTIVGIATLAFSSTVAFYTLQTSINEFWKVDDDKKSGLVQLALDRLISFIMVICLGIVVVFVLILETLFLALSNIIEEYFAINISAFYSALNLILPFIMVTFLFAAIFKYLPNAIIRWKDVTIGAAITAFLFLLGQLAISWHISRTNFSNVYGAANSIIIILAWVFYSAQILYFGAEFIYVYATKIGKGVKPATGNRFKIKIPFKKKHELHDQEA